MKRRKRDTLSDNNWQRMTASGTKSDKEWYNEWQGVKTNENGWQYVTRVVISANFSVSQNQAP